MTIFLLAVALAMDSVAVCIANGANYREIGIVKIVQISFIFAFFQGFMPLLGYFLGLSFVSFIEFIDHFIAFFILLFLGIKMLKESRQDSIEACINIIRIRAILLGAIATSIDALVVGITFSFEKTNIFYTCLIIAIVCFLLCLAGFYIGKIIGKWLQKKALVFGGVILIFLGFKILIEHLSSH